MKAEQSLTGSNAGPDPAANRELEMPIDLRAMFSIELLAKADLSTEMHDPEARLKSGIWRVDHLEIDGKPYALVFRSQHRMPSSQ